MNNLSNTAAERAKDKVEETKNIIKCKTEIPTGEGNQEIPVEAEQIGGKADNKKENILDKLNGRTGKIHEMFDTSQGFLRDKADVVNKYAHQTVEKADQINNKAAEVLITSLGYIKNFDVAETRRQLTAKIKDKPEFSIAVAGVFGLLIGLLIKRKK